MSQNPFSTTNERYSTGPGTLVPAIVGIFLGIGLLAMISAPLMFLGDDWRGRVLSSLPINILTFMAFGVASALLATRSMWVGRQHRAFRLNLLAGDDESLLLPDDALECRRQVRELPPQDQHCVLIR